MSHDLTNKAMLVKLAISQWTGRKYDREVSDKVAKQYGAAADSGRYQKMLVVQEAIKEVQQTVNATRVFNYKNTLPWEDDGVRLLPAANYMQYTAAMRKLKADFEKAVCKFVEAYPELVEEAKARLNGMYKAQDYPDADQIKKSYRFDIKVDPLADSQDFRVSLADEEIRAIKADIEIRIRQAQAEAMKDLWKRLYETVSHMAKKLGDQKAIFRDSLIINLRELCELLPRLNITGDPNLEKLKKEVESRLCCYTPNQLRDSKPKRFKAHQDASNILDAMAGYVIGETAHDNN